MNRAAPAGQRAASWPHWAIAVELSALAVVLTAFATIVIGVISIGSPLHWDEAVYAVRARSWVDPDAVLSGWSYIRPPVLPMIAGVPVLAGGVEWQLRAIGLVSGVGLLVAAWWTGRMLAGPIAGVLAAAVLAGSPTLIKESGTLLTDVPAAALLLAASALVWWSLEERPRPGRGLALAAGVGALAFLMRYGSVVVLAPMASVAAVLWWRQLWAHRAATLVALGVVAVLAAGHIAWSMIQTGAPLGILFDAQSVVSGDPRDLPIRDYRGYIPFRLAGSIGEVAMRLGIDSLAAAALAAALWPRWRRELRAALFLLLPALAQIYLVTRGVGHAEPRFFIYSTACLVIAGAALVAAVLRLVPPVLRWPPVVAIGVVLVLALPAAIDDARTRTEDIARYYHRFEVAAHTIAAEARRDCGIVGGGYPILAWYSGCETNVLRTPPGGNLEASDRWAVVFGDPDEIDLSAPISVAIAGAADGEPIRITDPATGAEIAMAWRLAAR
ncbi:MAG TPA: glycosyltransferase family 39 protein [Candidatus Limnocylindria bacterium]|nr:glycosyltransferase family 39 protein [Candidatus Limnocylindria bacterium]